MRAGGRTPRSAERLTRLAQYLGLAQAPASPLTRLQHSYRMHVEVFLTSANVHEEDVRDRTVVVIDVLRASSTIVTALQHGARAVVPVQDMVEASKIAQNLDPSVYLLGGERGGKKIDGYHLGNSPAEYEESVVEGRDVILNTTNGTKALTRSRVASHMVVGCFLNAARVVEAVQAAGLDVALVCAGQNNRISLEDTLCAGLLLHHLWEGQEPDTATDTAHIAFTQYLHDQDDLLGAMRRSANARRLLAQGEGADVDYCLQIDQLPVLPYYKDSRLVLIDRIASSSAA